jgi:hypothetical protein
MKERALDGRMSPAVFRMTSDAVSMRPFDRFDRRLEHMQFRQATPSP